MTDLSHIKDPEMRELGFMRIPQEGGLILYRRELNSNGNAFEIIVDISGETYKARLRRGATNHFYPASITFEEHAALHKVLKQIKGE